MTTHINSKASAEKILFCDECGKKMDSVRRIYKGARFCLSCYRREFKRAKCFKCGEVARVYVRDPEAFCKTCERKKGYPCYRCGKQDYEIGLQTEYGPVCKSCAVYFREPKVCAWCNTPSQRISKYLKYGIKERICQTCASRELKGTCQRCHRSRFLIETSDGDKICKTCADKGNVICPQCGDVYPAGFGNTRCPDCYFKDLLFRKVEINVKGFSSDEIPKLFREYGGWLLKTYGSNKASVVVNRHYKFFQNLDVIWQEVPPYDTLLAHYNPEGLRHYRTPMRFLTETGYIQVDTDVKERASLLLQIGRMMGSFSASKKINSVLNQYHARLILLAQKDDLSLRSVKSYLKAAIGLLERVGSWPVEQSHVDAYLSKVPGQRASLAKFVGYLREDCGMEGLAIPPVSKLLKNRSRSGTPEAEKKLLALISGKKSKVSYEDRNVLVAALHYYHGLLPSQVRKYSDLVLKEKNGGFCVCIGGGEYWLP